MSRAIIFLTIRANAGKAYALSESEAIAINIRELVLYFKSVVVYEVELMFFP